MFGYLRAEFDELLKLGDRFERPRLCVQTHREQQARTFVRRRGIEQLAAERFGLGKPASLKSLKGKLEHVR